MPHSSCMCLLSAQVYRWLYSCQAQTANAKCAIASLSFSVTPVLSVKIIFRNHTLRIFPNRTCYSDLLYCIRIKVIPISGVTHLYQGGKSIHSYPNRNQTRIWTKIIPQESSSGELRREVYLSRKSEAVAVLRPMWTFLKEASTTHRDENRDIFRLQSYNKTI